MSRKLIDYSETDGIAIIALDRPEKRNAMNSAMAEELLECWRRFDEGSARVAILTSSDPTIFSAGADLFDPPTAAWRSLPEIGFATDKPIIAAIGGKVIGLGYILAAMCDLCIAAEDGEFHFPEARLGFSIPAVAVTVNRLPPRIAMELLTVGEPLSARRAYEVGFVNRLTKPGEQMEAAMAMARTLAANAPLVVGNLKRLSLEALGRTSVQNHYSVLRADAAMMASADAGEGLAAFCDRRKPVFQGK